MPSGREGAPGSPDAPLQQVLQSWCKRSDFGLGDLVERITVPLNQADKGLDARRVEHRTGATPKLLEGIFPTELPAIGTR